MLKRVLSTLLALTLTAGSLCSTLIVSAAPPEPESKSTDFITSKTDIDELLRREYIDNVPMGYNENVFSLYQPGWGFDRNDFYRTGVSGGWGMPVTVKADGMPVEVQDAEFIPSYVTSAYQPDGSASYYNHALGAVEDKEVVELPEGVPAVWASFDQTTWGCKLDYAFDGEVHANGTKNWNTYDEPLRTGDEWLEITFPQATTVNQVKLFCYVDDKTCAVPQAVAVQYWDGSAWQAVQNPVIPAFAAGENVISFDAVESVRFKLILTPMSGKMMAFDEIEFLNSGEQNWAKGATAGGNPDVSVSFDQTQWGCKIDYAFDGQVFGNGGKNWNTWTNPIRTEDEWLEISFAGERLVDKVRLCIYQDSGDTQPPTAVSVRYWDGETWADVTGLNAPESYTKGWNELTFDNVKAQKFQLTITPQAGKSLAFDEIEFCGSEETNHALGAVKTEPVDPNEGKPRIKVSFDQTTWGNHCYFAFDGDLSQNDRNTWSTYQSTLPDGYEWVEIAYPEEITLDAVRLTVWDDGGNSRPPVSAGVQVWDEAVSDWKDVSNLKQPAAYVKGSNIITFDQVVGDRFRMTFVPTAGKWLAFNEIEMLEEMPSKNVEVTGYKYIAPDDKAAVMIEAKNLSEAPVSFEVAASSSAASTEDGAALTGTAAGFQLRIEGDEGFAAKDGKLVKAVTAAPGETVTFRVAMAFAEDAADNAAPLSSFFADSDPVATQKAAFNQWFLDTIPYVDLPDEQIKQIYYFRWYTYRNHIRMTSDDYYIISEFLPNVGWAGKHNSINCPAGLHVAEGRWLKNNQYLDDYLMHWLDRGGAVRSYSFWIANAYYERYLVNQDDYVLEYLEKLKSNYAGWDRERYDENMGLYWQINDRDGMENSVGGAVDVRGYRPTINAYQYADAMAIAELCRLVGDEEGAAEYTEKAETLKATMDEKLWDSTDHFYKLIPYGRTERADVREEIGYVPWMFNMPEDTEEHGMAWEALMDENGFFSEYGPRTTEKEYARIPTPEGEFGTGICRWDGPSWPFATTQTLVGMANLLNNYTQQKAVDKDDYFTILKTYAKSQYKNGAPWIAENLDADNGRWIADERRSPNYNHSQFANLVISGLLGIRPDDSNVLTINPLTPDDWDYFCLENVPYHNQLVTVLFDRDGSRYGQGAGFKVYVDGECVATKDAVEKTEVQLSETPVSESKAELRKLYNANRSREEGDYMADGWVAFDAAREDAKALLNKADASEAELKAAYDALFESLRGLTRVPNAKYEAEEAALTGLAHAGASATASGGSKVGTIDNAESSVTFTVDVPAAGDYEITITADGHPNFPNPSHKCYVNGDVENAKIVHYPDPVDWGVWKEYQTTLTLKEGVNTITFAYNDTMEKTFAELDCIELSLPPVDKTALGTCYDANKDKVQENYTPDSWTIFAAALENAKTALYNPDASQSALDKALSDLEAAVAGLEEVTPPEVDKTALKDLIEAAGRYEEGAYTAASWAALEEALEEANRVMEDKDATAEEVQTASDELQAAIDGLRYELNTELLEMSIELAEKTLTDFNLTEESEAELQAVIDEAKALLKNPKATQTDINEMFEKVIKTLAGIVEAESADKAMLNELIGQAEALNRGNYTPSTLAALDEALEAARAVSADETAEEAEVKAAQEALMQAIIDLKFMAQKDSLKAAYKLAEELTADEKYEEATLAELKGLMEEAAELLEDPEAEQAEVDAMGEKLTIAMAKVRLAQAVSEAKALKAEAYTEASWSAVESALKAAEEVLENGDAEKAEYEEQAVLLRAAMNALVEADAPKPVKPSKGGSTSQVAESDYWAEVVEKINGTEKGGKVNAKLDEGANVPATVIDALKNKGVTVVFEIGGKDYAVNGAGELKGYSAAAVYYTSEEVKAMAGTVPATSGTADAPAANSNPETGGEVPAAVTPEAVVPAAPVAPEVPAVIEPAVPAEAAAPAARAEAPVEAAEAGMPVWAIAAIVIAAAILGGTALAVAHKKHEK
ncbi:MGH1-like glycoside hydrolase domain-containing protein [Ligaoa zhengdingensis]|uniref:MGH1-like glycoside hydrolase domain-containing protein n=2 Tax=Ligaoa zhengdingensis TaxID=2763658 RepID=UPI0031BAF09E